MLLYVGKDNKIVSTEEALGDNKYNNGEYIIYLSCFLSSTGVIARSVDPVSISRSIVNFALKKNDKIDPFDCIEIMHILNTLMDVYCNKLYPDEYSATYENSEFYITSNSIDNFDNRQETVQWILDDIVPDLNRRDWKYDEKYN